MAIRYVSPQKKAQASLPTSRLSRIINLIIIFSCNFSGHLYSQFRPFVGERAMIKGCSRELASLDAFYPACW